MEQFEMTGPSLSVIMPTHNVENWVIDAVKSVLNSNFHDLELIVVDDASADGTWEFIQTVATQDSRVIPVHGALAGGGNCRNQGVSLARGRYLTFIDADDIVPPSAYTDLVTVAERDQADIVIGDFVKFDSESVWSITQRHQAYEIARSAIRLTQAPNLIRNRACWNKIYRRAFWEELRLSFPEVPRSNDIVLATRVLTEAERISVISRPVYAYRSRPGNSSMTSKANQLASFLSYVSQERLCAERIDCVLDPDVVDTYWRMLLQSDLMNHLRSLVASYVSMDHDEGRGLPQEIEEEFCALLDLCPEARLKSLKISSLLGIAFTLIGELGFAQMAFNDHLGERDDLEDFTLGMKGIQAVLASPSRAIRKLAVPTIARLLLSKIYSLIQSPDHVNVSVFTELIPDDVMVALRQVSGNQQLQNDYGVLPQLIEANEAVQLDLLNATIHEIQSSLSLEIGPGNEAFRVGFESTNALQAAFLRIAALGGEAQAKDRVEFTTVTLAESGIRGDTFTEVGPVSYVATVPVGGLHVSRQYSLDLELSVLGVEFEIPVLLSAVKEKRTPIKSIELTRQPGQDRALISVRATFAHRAGSWLVRRLGS